MNDFRKTPPPISEFPPLSAPSPYTVVLANGVKVHILQNGDQPVVRMTVCTEGGLADTADPSALSLMATAMREGTAKHSAAEISETLDYNGAWLKIEPMSHNLLLSFHGLSDTAPDILPLIKEIILSPAFPADKVDPLRRKMAAAARVAQKKVSVLASRANRPLIFGETHPLANPKDSPEEIERITDSNIRDAWECTFANARPEIFIAGDAERLLDQVTALFSDVAYDPVKAIKPTIIPINPMETRRNDITSEGALQSAVSISIPTIGRNHADYIDLRLAMMALGGYFGSRLMSNIREEKGLTYGISGALLGYREGGVASITSQTDPRNTERLIDETVKEIRRLQNEPMDAAELAAVRRYAMSALAATLDSPFSIMDLYITHCTSGTPLDYFSLQQGAISRLTSERITEVARCHLDLDSIKISVAGPAI